MWWETHASRGTLIPNNIDYTFDKPYFGVCETAAATQVKVVSCPGFELKTGSRIAVQFTYGNSASQPKLNVNGTGGQVHLQHGRDVCYRRYLEGQGNG